jgi:hypothetical protein
MYYDAACYGVSCMERVVACERLEASTSVSLAIVFAKLNRIG